MLRRFTFCLVVALALISGCTRMPAVEVAALKTTTFPELQAYLLKQQPDLELFRSTGPFSVNVQENHPLRLSAKEQINSDVFLSAAGEKAPLVILLHGYGSSKRAHAKQCMHLASWGIHCLTVQLPNRGPWSTNGRTLARIVNFIARAPDVIDGRIDPEKIILVGHSFGGAAVSVALAEGAPAAGGILLDPAAIGRDLPNFLRRIQKPVMVLGADDAIFSARNRDHFYRFIRGRIAEVSIRDAAHEDAQYPSEFALHNGGRDPQTTEELQITFLSALTAAAFSLSATGSFDYAWTSFRSDLERGKLFNPRKK